MHLRDIDTNATRKDKAEHHANADADTDNRQALQQHIGQNVPRLRPEGHPNTEFTCATAYRNGEYTSYSNHRNHECNHRESTEYNRVQTVWCQYCSAEIS